MWRYLAGAVGALLLGAGGLFWFRSSEAQAPALIAAPPPASAAADDRPLPDAPAASETTREQKRFSRYDKDRNGAISREEYLLARRKAYAKLDTNHDGMVSFDEYAVKTTARFTTADTDRSGILDAREFATTRAVRKAKPRAPCPPPAAAPADDDG